jgi:hypothetical protein
MNDKTFLRYSKMVPRGERMRKVLVFLLIVGILIGAFSVIVDSREETSLQGDNGPTGDEPSGDGFGNSAPCGGHGGGGGGTPG